MCLEVWSGFLVDSIYVDLVFVSFQPACVFWLEHNNYFKCKWIKCSNQDTDWLNGYKNKTHIYAIYKKSTSDLKTYKDWKWGDGKYIFHLNGKQKKAGVAILISDKTDFKIKKIKRDKEGHYIMIKGSIQEEDITSVNIQHRSTPIHKANTNRHKRRNWQ